MTVQEMHTAFRLGLDKTNSSSVASFEPNELDYWLNFSVERFVKQRLFGNNYRKEAFSNTQKRSEDLYTLLVSNPNLGFLAPTASPWITVANINSATSPLPKDFYDLIYSYVTYKKTKDPYSGNNFTRDIDIIDDTVYQNLTRIWGGLASPGNNISMNKIAYGRLLGSNEHSPTINTPTNSPYGVNQTNPLPRYLQVYVQSYSVIQAVGITYIRKWVKLDITTPTQVLELPEHTHQEIVDLAVVTLLENIGDPRYNTNNSEATKQE